MRITLLLVAATMFLGACNKFEKIGESIEYKIIESDDAARDVKPGDMLLIHMVGVVTSTDSAIFDSYKSNKPFYIPADEPTLKSLFALLHKGDTVVFKVLADTLYMKSFGQPRPTSIKDGETISFNLKLVDIYNQEELQKEIETQNMVFMEKDSVNAIAYIANITDLKSTESGINYQVITAGKGKSPKKGDKVTVKYQGTLLDGTVFDETKEGQPDFTFSLGMGQVIQGWDEILGVMKEGDEFKVIIPWKLAYGPRGSGPIPPYSTLIFNIKLVKVN